MDVETNVFINDHSTIIKKKKITIVLVEAFIFCFLYKQDVLITFTVFKLGSLRLFITVLNENYRASFTYCSEHTRTTRPQCRVLIKSNDKKKIIE